MAKRTSDLSKKSIAQLLKLQADAGKEFTALQERLETLCRIGEDVHREIQARSAGKRWWEKDANAGAGRRRGSWGSTAPSGTRGTGVPSRVMKFLQETNVPQSIASIMAAVKPGSKPSLAVALGNLKKKRLVVSPSRGMYALPKA